MFTFASQERLNRITNNTLDRFAFFTRYNVRLYFDLYTFFITNNLSNIVNFYTDSTAKPDIASFDFLQKLINESRKIDNIIRANRNSFNRVDDWEIIDILDEIKTKLQTILNTSKWTRSSKSVNSWRTATIQTQYTLSKGETLENVSEQVYGRNDSQDDWVRIALENDLREGDYNVNENKGIKVTKTISSSPNFFLFSVVDTLENENVYGLDVFKKLLFESGDLKVLNPRDTVTQSIQILISIKKGDIPEFPVLGVDRTLAIGRAVSALIYTSIVRQLEEVFRSDDSLRNFAVTNISYQSGDFTLNYNVDTFFNLNVKDRIRI